jgi:carbamoyl-phosphate synthase small subunit
MTYPLIGNYGAIKEDFESDRMWMSAIFVHEVAPVPSNFRCEYSLNDMLLENEIPGLVGINTRKLTKVLRESGTMKGMISNNTDNIEEKLLQIKNYKISGLVDKVTTKKVYTVGSGANKIALLDFGVKQNIIRCLVNRNCTVTVYPANTTSIDTSKFDGILLSNGPGDPEDCTVAIETIKELYKSNKPIFGICLGHQLMGLATGAKTAKLKYGHRGPNQPVKDLREDRVHITSQNHGYYILQDTIKSEIAEVSHINLNDDTVEGLKYKNKKIMTVQFHPEACPGPQDTEYLFDEFIKLVEEEK